MLGSLRKIFPIGCDTLVTLPSDAGLSFFLLLGLSAFFSTLSADCAANAWQSKNGVFLSLIVDLGKAHQDWQCALKCDILAERIHIVILVKRRTTSSRAAENSGLGVARRVDFVLNAAHDTALRLLVHIRHRCTSMTGTKIRASSVDVNSAVRAHERPCILCMNRFALKPLLIALHRVL
jgi:hypothetical protein